MRPGHRKRGKGVMARQESAAPRERDRPEILVEPRFSSPCYRRFSIRGTGSKRSAEEEPDRHENGSCDVEEDVLHHERDQVRGVLRVPISANSCPGGQGQRQ